MSPAVLVTINCRGNPSKYSLIDKVIDGMQVEVRSVLVFLKDPLFHAQLEMTDILIQSTSCEWKVVPLSKARYETTVTPSKLFTGPHRIQG